MTANRLPNHVTPTNKVFPIVSVACAITSIWDKGVHVRRILQEFGEKISDFLHFYSKDGKLFKRFVFCYRENLILVGNIVQKVQKKAPDYPRPKKYNVGGGYFFSSSLSPAT